MKKNKRRILILISGILVCLCGITLMMLGGWLAFIGGTGWYLLTGGGFLVSGILLALKRPAGFVVYILTFIVSIIQALVELGMDGWQLMPRLFAFALLGIWLSLMAYALP